MPMGYASSYVISKRCLAFEDDCESHKATNDKVWCRCPPVRERTKERPLVTIFEGKASPILKCKGLDQLRVLFNMDSLVWSKV